ncbi:MAG: hypothetical protein FD174_1944 [Geobacteraceae bacterium]|nr:MAG: hypothetical protein FD174_1944 [Geobacteraceae bacterium]
MKRLLCQLIMTFVLVPNVGAYQSDAVFIQELPKRNNSEAVTLGWMASGSLSKKLVKNFPCLHITTTSDKTALVEFMRKQQLVGSGTDQELAAAMDTFGKSTDAKYLVNLSTYYDPMVGYRLDALAWMSGEKSAEPFFSDGETSLTYEGILKGAESLAEQLVVAFVKKSSKQRPNNEVCPFKGRVDVMAITSRKEPKDPVENKFISYCNGQDVPGKTFDSFTVEGKQFWKLNRLGNPDTEGTMEYTLTETTLKEEVDGCHTCKSGRNGHWEYKDELIKRSVAEGLDTSTVKDGKSDNKDATINLHFSNNGTYSINVKAVSKEGYTKTTHTKTAVGTCDLINEKPKFDPEKFTIALEQRFEGFAGTPFDKKLTGKRTIKLPRKDNDEEWELTIDFDLERP